MRRRLTQLALLALAASHGHSALALDVLGTRPAHVWGAPSSVVNEQAMSRMIWAPGIDEGYVPQGIAWMDGAVYLSAYRSTDPKTDRGPCRIYKVDAKTGNTLGRFDLPADCGHAGGLAALDGGILIAADTRRLYRIDAAQAFSATPAATAITSTVQLRRELKASFIDCDGSVLLVGASEKDAAKAKAYVVPLTVFDTHASQTVDESIAIRSIALPTEAQGAAFDKAGRLWLTASNSRFGALYRVDATTGDIMARFDMVIGIEGLGFDDEGGLWSVSEAGSLRWRKWSKTFPVIFRIDIDRLSQDR